MTDGTGISAGEHGRDRRSSEEGEGGFGNPGFENAFVLDADRCCCACAHRPGKTGGVRSAAGLLELTVPT